MTKKFVGIKVFRSGMRGHFPVWLYLISVGWNHLNISFPFLWKLWIAQIGISRTTASNLPMKQTCRRFLLSNRKELVGNSYQPTNNQTMQTTQTKPGTVHKFDGVAPSVVDPTQLDTMNFTPLYISNQLWNLNSFEIFEVLWINNGMFM